MNKKQYYLHRLLWEAFIGEIPEGYEIDHIDGNPSNNVLQNLRIVTHKENMNNPNTIKRFSESNKGKGVINNQKTSKPVVQYSLNGDIIGVYPSLNEAYRKTGIDKSSISDCCRGKLKTAGEFVWRLSHIN